MERSSAVLFLQATYHLGIAGAFTMIRADLASSAHPERPTPKIGPTATFAVVGRVIPNIVPNPDLQNLRNVVVYGRGNYAD